VIQFYILIFLKLDVISLFYDVSNNAQRYQYLENEKEKWVVILLAKVVLQT